MKKLRVDMAAAKTIAEKLALYKTPLDELVTAWKDAPGKFGPAQAEAKKLYDEIMAALMSLKKDLACKIGDVKGLEDCRKEKLPKTPPVPPAPPDHPCVYLCCQPTQVAKWSTKAIEDWATARLADAKRLTGLDTWMKQALTNIKTDLDKLNTDVHATPPKAYDRAYLELLDLQDKLAAVAVYIDSTMYTAVIYMRAARSAVEQAIVWYRYLACAQGKDAGLAEEQVADAECTGVRTVIDDILECVHDKKANPDPTPCEPTPPDPCGSDSAHAQTSS